LFGSTALSNLICLVAANLALLLLVRLLTTQTAVQVEWSAQVLISIASLFAGVFGFVHQQLHWHRPMRRVRELIGQVRSGDAAIGELRAIGGGGIAPLLADVESLLRDLRQHRADVAQLELELSQRVANRTDALERSMAALKQQATKDGLTGLNNRRMFDVHLPLLVERCRAKRLPLTLLMIDVDDFKLLNDTLGHAAGDEFLRSLGQIVRSTLRATDLAYRYGGDEFVVAIPGGSRDEGDVVARRLASLIDALGKTLKVASPPRLSIGLMCSTELAVDAGAEDLLREADRLLYETKAARKAAKARQPAVAVAA
jgi:diguanylate cyclase (GGDEF)-like protein